VDTGTPELRAQRLATTGRDDVSAEHPLDILAAAGLLALRHDLEPEGDWQRRNVTLRDAGAKFAELHRQIIGRSSAPAIDPHAPAGSPSTTVRASDRLADARYKQARQALRAWSAPTLKAVMDAAVYMRPVTSMVALEHLRQGLRILVALPPVRIHIAPAPERRILEPAD
jgi:hypothetical protein